MLLDCLEEFSILSKEMKTQKNGKNLIHVRFHITEKFEIVLTIMRYQSQCVDVLYNGVNVPS